MKLKKAVNEKTGWNVLKVSFNGSGVASFNKYTTKELELEGKNIDFYEDEDNPGDWYLHISNDAALSLRMNKDVAQVSCTDICNKIKKSTKHLTKKTMTALLAEKSIEESDLTLWPLLITKGNH